MSKVETVTIIISNVDESSASIQAKLSPEVLDEEDLENSPCLEVFYRFIEFIENGKFAEEEIQKVYIN